MYITPFEGIISPFPFEIATFLFSGFNKVLQVIDNVQYPPTLLLSTSFPFSFHSTGFGFPAGVGSVKYLSLPFLFGVPFDVSIPSCSLTFSLFSANCSLLLLPDELLPPDLLLVLSLSSSIAACFGSLPTI